MNVNNCSGEPHSYIITLEPSAIFSHQTIYFSPGIPLTSLSWSIYGATTKGDNLWVSDFHIFPTGYIQSDPAWYKTQDVNPVEFNTNDQYMYATMATMGWYETNEVNGFVTPVSQDQSLRTATFNNFTQYYTTNIWAEMNSNTV